MVMERLAGAGSQQDRTLATKAEVEAVLAVAAAADAESDPSAVLKLTEVYAPSPHGIGPIRGYTPPPLTPLVRSA
eukprot:2514534-Pyramimonas_sp.AAC.1